MAGNGRIYPRRRTYLVEKSFQVRFILKFCLVVLAGALISTLLVLLLTRGSLTSSFEQSRLVIKSTASAILPAIAYTNLITLALITLSTVIVTLFVSHKIAGPIYRFEKELEEIASGDLTRKIALRRKDQITNLAQNLNQMVSNFNRKISELKQDIEDIKKTAQEDDTPGEIIEKLEQLNQKIDKYFKI